MISHSKVLVMKFTSNAVKYFKGDWIVGESLAETAYRILKENRERRDVPIIIVAKSPSQSRYGPELRIIEYLGGLDWVHKTYVAKEPDGVIFLPKKAVKSFSELLQEAIII